MPIYEYECLTCSTKFEALRPMKDADAEINCKTCQSTNTKRALSLCYSKSDGRSGGAASGGGGCGGCSGGSCGSCGH